MKWIKIKNKNTMNKTQLKNLNKMSDRKNAEQKDSEEQRWTKELGCEQRGTRTITIGLCA